MTGIDRQSTREFFDGVAAQWERLRQTLYGEGVRRAALSAARVGPGMIVADIGTGTGFLADTCARWEEAARAAEASGVRVVLARTGIVLERGGGALKMMVPPFLMFMGGPLGSGRQAFPWVHRDDVVGAILFALERPEMRGPVNVTAPQPVTLAEFCKALGRALARPSWLPAPAIAVRLLAGEMADEMLLSGARVVPSRLLSLGYAFRYPKLDAALAAIFSREPRGAPPSLQPAAP